MRDNIKILIVEDNPNDVDLLQHELKKSGLNFSYEVVQTENEFIAALDNFEPEIILSDYSLPSFDGLTAFHIKQKKSSHIPFIIISGSLGEENAVELIINGVTDYVLKDKLFSIAPKIKRAIKESNEIKEKKDAVEKLKLQNEKLFEIAFLQSHQVRVPVAQILGLYNLFNFNNPSDPVNSEILRKLKITAETLDNVVHQVVQKTNIIRKM